MDKNETTNLAGSPEHASLLAMLKQRLADAGATGPPLASAFVVRVHRGERRETTGAMLRMCSATDAVPHAVALQAGIGPDNSTVTKFICDQQQEYGFLEPMDWQTNAMGEQ